VGCGGGGKVTGAERSISLTVLGAVHATDDAEVVTLGITLDILQQTTSANLAEVQYLHRGGIQADQTSSFLGAPSVEL
jgi:hypothetical protein